jgi:hypothetical protein
MDDTHEIPATYRPSRPGSGRSNGNGSGPRPKPRLHARRGRIYRRRRIWAVIWLVLTVFVIWLAISLGSALTNPTYGSSLSARFAEWARQNGGGSIVNSIENYWYTHHPPKVGGTVPHGAIVVHGSTPTTIPATAPPHLPAPTNIVPLASPALPGEGVWSAVGRPVGGVPAVYTTQLRPDAIHTSYVVGVAWMDMPLLHATLYSGSQIPGGGPFVHSAPVTPTAATTLVSAFNAGFLMASANGGYYTDGKTLMPLRNGAASAVIYANGSMTVADWGRDATLTSNVVAVRQNLDLIVDGGQPVAGLNANDTTQWGATLGNAVYVYRSGLGVTANGAIVYVGGPGLNITDLATLLVRAGAVRGMELDINTDWVNYSFYTPAPANGPATPQNGSLLLPQMLGTAGRYFEPYWARDFFTMSAAYPPTATSSTTATTKPKSGNSS